MAIDQGPHTFGAGEGDEQKRHRASDSDRGIFLSDPPAEIGLLLRWFEAGARPEQCSKELEGFACSFLAALAEDQALIPAINVHPAKLLVGILTHHLRSPGTCAAWLNLGWALRLMARSDAEPVATARLQRALECFDRSLALGQSERAVVIRAWAGKAFVLEQLRRFEEGVQCSREALELDRSDPNLWLLYSSLLEAAGRKEEALELIDEAYKAYVMAGRPEGLRHLFDAVVPPVNAPDPAKHLRRMQ
jgi:tetratricopeptide (TPR) repeat protein